MIHRNKLNYDTRLTKWPLLETENSLYVIHRNKLNYDTRLTKWPLLETENSLYVIHRNKLNYVKLNCTEICVVLVT